MARLHQPPPFYGTYKGICIYQLYAEVYMRTASSLTGETEGHSGNAIVPPPTARHHPGQSAKNLYSASIALL